MSDCWIWSRGKTTGGYGSLRRENRHVLAHRLSYQTFNGKIPDGYHILHKCDNPSCVNPDHLFAGTNQDNILDSVNKGRRKGITRKRPSGLVYKKRMLIDMRCQFCGEIFQASRIDAKWCSVKCKEKGIRRAKNLHRLG